MTPEEAHWRGLYEESRARLAKLWILYEQVREERDLLREEAGNSPVPTLHVREPIVVYESPREPALAATPGPTLPAPTPAAATAATATTPATTATQPFQYGAFTLYSHLVTLKNGDQRPIYFFSRQPPRNGTPVPKPNGYHVGVNARTGLPFLKKGLGGDGETLPPNLAQAYRPQCVALTEDGPQCRNSARHGSRYCASHFGYQPPAISKAQARREDTVPRVRLAPDTKPATRKQPE